MNRVFFILFIALYSGGVSQACARDSIFIKMPEQNDSQIKYNVSRRYKDPVDDRISVFSILVGGITEESKKDRAAYVLNVSVTADVKDSNAIDRSKIYTPEMIMDSLSKYRHDYITRNRQNFYVTLKGQGPIWYLHKASLTYIYANYDGDVKVPLSAKNIESKWIHIALNKALPVKKPQSLSDEQASSIEFAGIVFKENGYNIVDSVLFNTKDTGIIRYIKSAILGADFSKISKQSSDTLLIIPFIFMCNCSEGQKYTRFPTDALEVWAWWYQFEKYKVIQPFKVDIFSKATEPANGAGLTGCENAKKLPERVFEKEFRI